MGVKGEGLHLSDLSEGANLRGDRRLVLYDYFVCFGVRLKVKL